MIFELEPVFNNVGCKIDIDYECDLSDPQYGEDDPFRDPVRVSGRIYNEAGIVCVKAKAEFVFRPRCDRCAAPIERKMTVPVEHILVRELNDETNDELILLDSFSFELDELVTADIFLMMPSKILCREDCRGICPQCGQDLNEGQCSCQKPTDPRLEVLKQLLDND